MARRTESTVTGRSGGDVRTGMTPESLAQAVADHLRYTIGRLPAAATPEDYYRALALAVRDRMQERWTRTRWPASIRTARSPAISRPNS